MDRTQITIRLPAELKEELRQEAERRGDSFNETVIRLVCRVWNFNHAVLRLYCVIAILSSFPALCLRNDHFHEQLP